MQWPDAQWIADWHGPKNTPLKQLSTRDHTYWQKIQKKQPVSERKQTKKSHRAMHGSLNGMIKDHLPKNLKISPMVAIPHKSCLFCTILDLLFKLQLHRQWMKSINKQTTPQSNHKAMEQLGQVLWCIVTTIAQTDPNKGPIVMAKWDIKDSFW